ncbi:MAG: hypothetical protein WC822_06730, partial [Candidatus Paceibacterota bacterium]
MANIYNKPTGRFDPSGKEILYHGAEEGFAAAQKAPDYTQPNVAGPVGTRERISRIRARSESPEATALDVAEKGLTAGLGKLATEAPSKETIFEQKQKQANALIDVIRQQFNEVIAGEQEAGAGRAARVRALNISSGLAGSDFASAAAEEDVQATEEIINTKKAERDAKIASVLSDVPSQADEAYAKAAEQYRTNAEAGITAIKNFRDSARTRATESLGAIAAAGGTFDDVQASPNYQKLLDAYGGDENAVKGSFINSIPKKNQLGSTTVGNKYLTFYYDPVTGNKSSVSFDLPQSLGPSESVQQVFANGQVAIKTTTYDTNGNKKESIRIETAKGYVPGSGSTTFSDEDKRQLSQAGLQNAEERVRSIFVNTPTGFRQKFTQEGKGTGKTTPEEVLTALEVWEAEQGTGGGNPFASTPT